MTTHEGARLCGAVRYRVTGAPLNVRTCHCRLCQKAMGSPFYARALFPAEAVEVTDDGLPQYQELPPP